MCRINCDHDNRPAPEGGFGGAMCMCNKCQNKRDREALKLVKPVAAAQVDAVKMPTVNKSVLVCCNDGENVYFMVAHRTHEDIFQSFVYYSPEHGQEFELNHVVEWHPLPQRR